MAPPKLATEWYQHAFAQDGFDASSNIGFLYQYGLGVPADYKEAMKWYMIAASKSHHYALNTVSNQYHAGLGVTKSVFTAIKCYTKAALLGESGEGAQCNLAVIYETDVKYKDLQKAVNWYQATANVSSEQAMEKIGSKETIQNADAVLFFISSMTVNSTGQDMLALEKRRKTKEYKTRLVNEICFGTSDDADDDMD
ncbi:hypothetical protein K501DRAFT_268714 [Backusella circina FSU 941]|nr:hypothetical protein K501DRAFT_268714 [Backusella circina FSU 941]